MDMLARQLSQIATSISEIRGNEERIPTTVKMSGKENISSITLQPDEEQVKPKLPLEEEESSGRGGGDKLIKETEEAGDHRRPKEVASEERKETEGKKEVPTTIKENVSVAVENKSVSAAKRSENGRCPSGDPAGRLFMHTPGRDYRKHNRQGRPFLKTAKAIINVFDGTRCLDYYGEKYILSLNGTKKPTDMEDLHSVEDIAPPVYEYSMEELLQ
ncbi:hypothetical protein AAHA92_17441 [Salvia divinorum]|uniref:Uncharacterized protein n=1 Tax=Salvia divinorum TaxID=28513 RepID=A0ABD1GYT5_SALDI